MNTKPDEAILGAVPHDLSKRRMIKWHTYTSTGKRGLFLMARQPAPYKWGLIDTWTASEALELLRWLSSQEAELVREAEKHGD